MPKLKTNKSAAKRFRVTRKGKVIRHMAGHGHLLAKKSSKRKRNLRKVKRCAPLDAKRIKRWPNSPNKREFPSAKLKRVKACCATITHSRSARSA